MNNTSQSIAIKYGTTFWNIIREISQSQMCKLSIFYIGLLNLIKRVRFFMAFICQNVQNPYLCIVFFMVLDLF